MSQTRNLLRNAVDASIASTRPSNNYAGAKRLHLESGVGLVFVFFNRSFPLGATIVSAKLRVYTRGSWGITPTLTVRRVLERWGVNKVTWNNQPDVGGIAAQTTQSSAADGHQWEFDVTSALQSVSNGAVWFGFRIGTDSTAKKFLYSANAVDHKPELEVVWSEAPQPPTNLSPSGSRAVSIAKPTLQFDFTDRRGSTALQAVQVQIDADGTWASPDFDSGTVLATEPELDLTTTAYPGLTAGQETRWRVRVQDGAGLWSQWSDVERFRRDNKGTLTIDNPGAPPNDFVSEWTPPIAWSLTGETQRAWQVFVTPVDEPATRLYDTGRTRGTDNSWTLPKGVIEDEEFYRVVVRIWDTKDREHTPGDPVWTQSVREFQFREDPTPNPVTGLTLENLLPRPWIRLEWDRSTMPDRFVVKRDGRVVEIIDDPADVLESGSHYGWTDRDPAPWKTHDWKVQVVVNGVTSGGPVSSLEVRSQGIWLYDHDRDIDVFIVGRDEGTWGMGEEATTHFPLGRDQGVRITQSLRGYEGTITGELVEAAGKTAEGWEKQLLRIKGRPGRVCTLSLGDEAFRCVVGNISVAPTPTTPITRRVSFDFWQVGRLGYDVRW